MMDVVKKIIEQYKSVPMYICELIFNPPGKFFDPCGGVGPHNYNTDVDSVNHLEFIVIQTCNSHKCNYIGRMTHDMVAVV